MTEAEWEACADPTPMLEFLRGKGSDRKLRLFGCAACRHVWHLFTDDRSRKAVGVVERFADGIATREEMAEAEKAASDSRDLAVGPSSNAHRRHRSRAGRCTSWAAYALTNVPDGGDICEVVWVDVQEAVAYAIDAQRGRCRENGRAAAALLRDIFGPLPSRPVTIPASVRAWNGGTVVRLAQAAYECRRLPAGILEPERLAVLADALEEAGCSDPSILTHLRGSGPHVRGCHVLDALLGKG